jgi:HTH-type transcriptional regulator / antitoxin HigA
MCDTAKVSPTSVLLAHIRIMIASTQTRSEAPPAGIESESEYRHLLDEMGTLMSAPEGSPEFERLMELADLIEAYEEQHYPMGNADAISMISFYMDQRGVSPQDLEPVLGGATRVRELLNRRKPLTLEMVRKIHSFLEFPLEFLIEPYALTPAAPRASRTSTRVPPSNGRDQPTSAPIKSAR